MNTSANFCPCEFGAGELPEIFAQGFRYATHVSVFKRIEGVAVGRYRRAMAVCGDKNVLLELGGDDV